MSGAKSNFFNSFDKKKSASTENIAPRLNCNDYATCNEELFISATEFNELFKPVKSDCYAGMDNETLVNTASSSHALQYFKTIKTYFILQDANGSEFSSFHKIKNGFFF